MYVDNKVSRIFFAKIRVFSAVSFCLILIENAWGWKLPSNKSLVVYFSNFGDTQMAAKNIQKRLSVDILRLKSAVKYPENKISFAAQMDAEFAARNDFAGKIVYFFSTYSENAGAAIDEMKKACSNATHGSSLKVELRTPLHDEKSVMIPNDIIEKWTAEIMAKQR